MSLDITQDIVKNNQPMSNKWILIQTKFPEKNNDVENTTNWHNQYWRQIWVSEANGDSVEQLKTIWNRR